MKLINQALLTLLFAAISDNGFASCNGRLLVSDYTANNVAVFDACSGDFIRNLDDANRLRGPQALRIGPDQRIYVVSEENARIIRYDQQTLEYIDTFIFQNSVTPQDDLGGLRRPTGLTFGSDGDLYIGGFDSDNVGRFDGETGTFKSIVYEGQQLDGPDAGLIFTPDGQLLIPSYENSRILKVDPTSGQLIQTIQDPQLNRPRVILLDEQGDEFIVSSWASGGLLRFNTNTGGFIGVLGNNTFRPTGLEVINGNELLIGSDAGRAITRRNLMTGENLTPLISNADSPLQTATFMLFLPNAATAQVNEQYWLVGTGPISGARLDIPEAVSATGGIFGPDFDPQAIERPVWGNLSFDFVSCTEAMLSYQSGEAPEADFGSGGYPIVKAIPNAAQERCETMGFDAQTDNEWMTGTWFGGPERDGEGFLIDVFGDQAFVAWFTFSRPN